MPRSRRQIRHHNLSPHAIHALNGSHTEYALARPLIAPEALRASLTSMWEGILEFGVDGVDSLDVVPFDSLATNVLRINPLQAIIKGLAGGGNKQLAAERAYELLPPVAHDIIPATTGRLTLSRGPASHGEATVRKKISLALTSPDIEQTQHEYAAALKEQGVAHPEMLVDASPTIIGHIATQAVHSRGVEITLLAIPVEDISLQLGPVQLITRTLSRENI